MTQSTRRSRLTSFVNGLKAIVVVAAMVLCRGVLPCITKSGVFTQITANQTNSNRVTVAVIVFLSILVSGLTGVGSGQ